MFKKILFLVVSLILSNFSIAQDPIGTIQKVADKIIDQTQFGFQLELSKPNQYFDYLESLNFGQT